MAARAGDDETLAWLCMRPCLEQRFTRLVDLPNYNTALHHAAARGHKSTCAQLLERAGPARKAEMIGQRNRQGFTAQTLAVRAGHRDVAELLVASFVSASQTHDPWAGRFSDAAPCC